MRERRIKTSWKAAADANWRRMYAYADWSVVGAVDRLEIGGLVLASVAERQLDEPSAAERDWERALKIDPVLALSLRNAIANSANYVLPNGVPGNEPTDLE